MDDRNLLDTPLYSGKHGRENLEIKVIAVAEEKVYDGTEYSMRAPTVIGTPADNHVVIVTQKYKDKHSGETALVPYIRITDGSGQPVDYVITIQQAMGMIRPRPVAVWAQADTKEYDGTTLSSVLPGIDNLAYSDSAVASQVFDTADIGEGKTLTPQIRIDDGNEGKNYVVTLHPTHTGTILARLSGVEPIARKIIASYLDMDDFMIMKLNGGLANFTGEVCHVDEKNVYVRVEARKRVQLVIELARISEELAKTEVGKRLQIVVKGKEIEVQPLGQGSSSVGHGRGIR